MKEHSKNEDTFDKDAINKAIDETFQKKLKELEDLEDQDLIITLIGSVNSGKSSTINALTGIEYTEVKPIAGWTKEVKPYQLKENVYICDTPGLYDVNRDVSKKASLFVEEKTDLILFFINAASGITFHDKECFGELEKLDKDIIVVVTKIDLLEEDEIRPVLEQINNELGPGATVVGISPKTMAGVSELNIAINDFLEIKGKEILYAKVSKHKESIVRKWINGAAVSAGGLGALPVPGSDIVPLTALQVALAMKIAKVYGYEPSKKDVMHLLGSTITGTVGKQLARIAITSLKASGWIPGAQLLGVAVSAIAASVAASITYGFGWACNAFYKSGTQIDSAEFQAVFEKSVDKYKKGEERNRPQEI